MQVSVEKLVHKRQSLGNASFRACLALLWGFTGGNGFQTVLQTLGPQKPGQVEMHGLLGDRVVHSSREP